MKPKNRSTLLPSNIVNLIEELKLKGRKKQYAYKILDLIFNDFLEEELMFDQYRNYPCTYWKKAVCEHYERVMYILEVNKVIQVVHSYSTLLHQCKKYRINPNLIDESIRNVSYIDLSPQEKQNDYICKKTRQVLRFVKIDKVKAKRFVKAYLSSGEIEAGLKFNEDVLNAENLPVFYKPQGQKTYKKSYIPKCLALEKAKSMGMDLIQDKRKIFIKDKERYIREKKRKIWFSYNQQINRISRREFYAKRNDTNNRLDLNLTNMASVLLPFVTLDGEPLVGLDLSNSQFVFLATLIEEGYFNTYLQKVSKPNIKEMQNFNFLLRAGNYAPFNPFYLNKDVKAQINKTNKVESKNKKSGQRIGGAYMCAKTGGIQSGYTDTNPWITRDLADFVKLAKNGCLYERIQAFLNLEEGDKGRRIAKGMMFLIFFSKHDYKSTVKKRVRELFPTLIRMIDLFKAEKRQERKMERLASGLEDDKKGDNQFAITLQQKESEVFIDQILNALFKSGYKVLSKHDSILCKKNDLEAAKEFISEVLDSVLGETNYVLKEELKNGDE